MTKSATIDALIENAILHFARFGFEGASLREIAADAGATLSAIDRYFGSKAELYRAVRRQVWAEVEREREALAGSALERTGSGRLQPAELIFVLARPIVTRALSDQPVDVARTALLRDRRFSEQQRGGEPGRQSEPTDSDKRLSRWISELERAFPELSRQEAAWAFSYLSGLIYSRQLIERRYEGLFTPEYRPSVESVTADIVAFGCAGLAALCSRAAAAASRTAAGET